MVSLAWGGYANGEIPLSALAPVGNGQYLRKDVARQLDLMLDTYVAGTGNKRPIVNSGYRSLEGQQWMLDHPAGQLVAAVGFSTHGWAITPDLSDTGRHPITPFSAWLDEHAAEYGFRRTIASESWHYQGGFPATITAALDYTRITEQDDLMPYPTVRNGDPADKSVAMLTSEALLVPFESMAQYEAARMTGAVSEYYQFPDGLGYRLLAERTARVEANRAASGAVDIDALAKRLAPLLTSPVLAALKASHGLTSDDVVKAVKSVFASASK